MNRKIRDAARRRRIRDIFQRIAAQIHPDGHLRVIADSFGWHRSTLWKWAEAGSMPKRKAMVLVTRYGTDLGFTLAELTGEAS